MANNTSTKKLVNELEKAVDESKKLVKLTDATNELYIEIAKNIKSSFGTINKSTTKGIQDVGKAITNTNTILEKQNENNEKRVKINDDLEKQEKKLVTLRKKLNDGLSEEAIETEKLNTQIREQNKKRKETVNDSLGLVSAYSKESKALRKMKNELKSNIIEMRKLGKSEKEIAKATKATTKEINKLDRGLRDLDKSVGDSYREIGKYEEALDNLKDAAEKTGNALTAIGAGVAVGVAVDAIVNTDNLDRESQKIVDKLGNLKTGTSLVTGSTGVTSAKEIVSNTSAMLDFSSAISDNALELTKAQAAYTASYFFESKEELAARDANIERLKEEGRQIVKNRDAHVDSRKARKADDPNVIQAAKNTINALNNVTDKTLEVELANEGLTITLSKQIKEQQKLKALSEDDNKGLKELLVLKDKLAIQDEKVARTQERIAKNELDVQVARVGAEFVAKGLLTTKEASLLTSEKTNELLKDERHQLALTSETAAAYTQAKIGFIDATTESEQTALETQEKRTKILSDAYEIDLDALIDHGDKLKIINEKIIADDNISNERRQELLTETRDQLKTNLDNQIKTVVDFTHKRIDLDKTTTDSQKKVLKEKVSASKIEELLKIKDSKLLAEKLRELGVSEIFETRTLEIIRERIQVNADLTQSQKDVNKALRDTNEINEDIIDQEALLKVLNDEKLKTQEEIDAELEKLEEERRQNRLAAIEEEFKAVDEKGKLLIQKGSLEEVALIQEKNDILLEQAQIAADKRLKIKSDEIAARKKLIEDGVKVIENVLANSREKQNKELDAEIDAIENRINDVQNAIENGSSGAAQSLAELEQKKIEAEKQKEELRKKEIRDQKIIAGLQLLASNDGNVGKTIGDVSLLLAALSNLPSFFDGTENTGTVSNPLDSNGGRTVMLHDNERVMTAKQNAKIGGISNEDLADLGAMHKTGALNGGTTVIQANNQELVDSVKRMEKAILNQPSTAYNYDANGRYHEQVIKANNKKEILKSRANNVFR